MRRFTRLLWLVTTIAALPSASPALAAQTAPIVVPAIGGAAWTANDVATLRADLDSAFQNAASLAAAHVGVLAIDTATGRVLYERNADQEFQPASTLKLVVGSAAIERLGVDRRPFTAAMVEPATTLEVVPSGDPFFALRDVNDLAAFVATHGHATIADVIVDTSIYEADEPPAGWTFDDFAEDYAPTISAAVLDENVEHLRVEPGSAPGEPAALDPGPAVPSLAASLDTCNSANAFLVNDAVTGASKSENTLDVRPSANGCRELVGSIASDDDTGDIDVAIPNPAAFLARTIVSALRAHGVRVTGEGSTFHQVDVTSARAAEIAMHSGAWIHFGIPLRSVMPRFWIPSDNFVGETLLMQLGELEGHNYSREKGLAFERDWLRSIGVDPATTTLADGSGLSQYDRITPRDLVTILQHDWNGPNRQLVLDSLPIGGARGTIEGIAGTPAAGRVFAKTGSMMHVRGLAGYLATERHGAVTFAFEVDDWIGDYKDLAATRAAVLSRIIKD